MQNVFFHDYESELYKNEPVGGNHFHMNDVAQRLVLLTQRQKPTQKRLIVLMSLLCTFAHHSFALGNLMIKSCLFINPHLLLLESSQ